MGCCIFRSVRKKDKCEEVPASSRPTSASERRSYGALANSEETPALRSQSRTPSVRYTSGSYRAEQERLIEPPLDITLDIARKATFTESVKSKKSTLTRGIVQVRIATWNLLTFSQAKASDPEVLQTIVNIILSNELDLIAVQELSDKVGLGLVCSELNKLYGNSWKYKVSDRAGRMYKSNEYLGFLWNSSKGFQYRSGRLLTGNKDFARSPYLAYFKINHQNLLLVNVHLKAVGLAREDVNRTRDEVDLLSLFIQSIDAFISKPSVHAFFLGDFNLPPDADFDRLYMRGFQNLLAKGTPTNISARNPRGSMSYDNIWVSLETLHNVYGGSCQVIREGLVDDTVRREDRQPTVSDHCPVWANFNF